MEIYGEPKDPTELKDYEFNWSAQLGEGETVVNQTVSFVDAAGTGNPTNSLATPYSRVWLSGGTDGQRAIYTIKAVTSGGRELEVALAVNIVDSTTVPTELDELKADLVVLNAAIRAYHTDGRVTDVSRDGRRIVRQFASLKEMMDHREWLKCEIAAAENVASGGNRRRPILLQYQV